MKKLLIILICLSWVGQAGAGELDEAISLAKKIAYRENIMRSDNPVRIITRLNPARVVIKDGAIEEYLNELKNNEEFVIVTSEKAAWQLNHWLKEEKNRALKTKFGDMLKSAVYVNDKVNYAEVIKFYDQVKKVIKKPKGIIAIGMGSVIDWAKIIGHKLDVDVDIIPSSMSTNAMFTAISAVRDGWGNELEVCVQKTGAPRLVIIDLDFVQQYKRGNVAGSGDLFCIWIGLADWLLAIENNQAQEDKPVYDKALMVLQRLDQYTVDIRDNNKLGIKVLAELAQETSVLMSRSVFGRPKGCSEHILSDQVEREVQKRGGEKTILHGEQIAVCTLLMAYFHPKLPDVSSESKPGFRGLYNKIQAIGLPLSLDQIGLTKEDLVNALVEVKIKKGMFSYFDLYKISEAEAIKAVAEIFPNREKISPAAQND